MIGVLVGAGEGGLAACAEATVGGLEAKGGGALGRTGALMALGAALTAPLGLGAGDCVGAAAGGFATARGATSGRDCAPPAPAPGIIGRGGNNTGRGEFWPPMAVLGAAVGAALGAAIDGGGAWRGGG